MEIKIKCKKHGDKQSNDEMLKVYQKDIVILKMQKKGTLKKLAKIEKELKQTQEYCRQIIGRS